MYLRINNHKSFVTDSVQAQTNDLLFVEKEVYERLVEN
jgi:hypothetical protein